MPELPEVETIRRSLLPHVPGSLVEAVEVRERRLRTSIAAGFEERLRGRLFTGIERRGKYLLFGLDDDETLLTHLGMSGSLALQPLGTTADTHDHVRIVLDRKRELVLNDPRRFGLMKVGRAGEFPELNNVGPDPLQEDWPAERLRAIARDRKLPIKNLLMDQRVICGIGNIYVSEMLFRAGIRPRRRADTLRRRECEALALAMRSVLEEAVRLGGSSISDFRDGDGRMGYFQLHHAVYDREGEPCPRCGESICRVVLSGRSSFFCAGCQR